VLYAGVYARVLRGEMITALNEDYVRTARAKGISEGRILIRHALRCSLIAFVSLFGLDFGALVGGYALLTEVVFGLQRIGKLTYDSLQSFDLPVIMATVIYAPSSSSWRTPRSTWCTPGWIRGCVMAEPLLEVRDLTVAFRTRQGLVTAVDNLSFQFDPGQVLGIVGESRSGKSVTCLAICGC